MTDSSINLIAQTGYNTETTATRIEGSSPGQDAPNRPKLSARTTTGFIQEHERLRRNSLSNSESHSSDDGIEWDTSAYYSSEHDSEQDSGGYDGYSTDAGDDDRESTYEDQDTRHLLATSKNACLGGMGMGMRVGETGTGTTIGLDLECDYRQHYRSGKNMSGGDDDDYDVLPLTRVSNDPRQSRTSRSESERQQAGKRLRKKSHRNRSRGLMHTAVPVMMLTEQEKLIAKKQLRIKLFWSAFYIVAWYGCSTSLSFYNKWLFSPNHYSFRFPLFTTCLHMVTQFLLSSITLSMIPSLRPQAAPSAKDFGTKIMPCALASGLDIGLSNNSLKSITLAFYTMCKSSSLAFVLLFAFLFKLERPTWALAGVIGVISIGLFMMVMSEVNFVLAGFIQVMLASVLGGLRWSLTQLLLERTNTKSGSLANPISTIFFLSPIMGICLFIVAGVFEGYTNIFSSEFFQTVDSGLRTLGLLLLGGIFAFSMVLAEFNLIARTSVVSLSVLGIIKEVITIIISSLVFDDKLTVVNILGLFITLSGIGFYHFMKLRELKAKARKTAKEIASLNIATSVNSLNGGGADLAAVHSRRRKRQSKGMHHRGKSKLDRPIGGEVLLDDEAAIEMVGESSSNLLADEAIEIDSSDTHRMSTDLLLEDMDASVTSK